MPVPGRRAAVLVLALAASSLAQQPQSSLELTPAQKAGDWAGECKAGVWNEGAVAALESAAALPTVQCWRQPPCIRWNWATPQKCKERPNDSDWPTADPHLPSDPPGQHTMKELLDGPWKGKTVVLVGDSINNLVYHAALCEAAKVYEVTHSAWPTTPEIKARVDAYSSTLAKLTVKDNTEMHGSLWMAGPPGLPNVVHGSGTLIVPKGWHKWKESDMAGLMELADVIVVNYGLHYQNNMSEYEEAMPQMLAQLEAFAAQPGKAALFRETNVEHTNVGNQLDFYETDVGHPSASVVSACYCQQRPQGVKWIGETMNKFVHGLLGAHPHVGVIPFYDLTQPRHDMHEAGYCAFEGLRGHKAGDKPPYCCDCTHFCYTPQLWKAFFSGVFDAHTRVAQPA